MSLEVLLEFDADPLAVDSLHLSPAHLATLNNQPDVLDCLLRTQDASAVANYQDHRGRTPLHAAAHMCHLDCCQVRAVCRFCCCCPARSLTRTLRTTE